MSFRSLVDFVQVKEYLSSFCLGKIAVMEACGRTAVERGKPHATEGSGQLWDIEAEKMYERYQTNEVNHKRSQRRVREPSYPLQVNTAIALSWSLIWPENKAGTDYCNIAWIDYRDREPCDAYAKFWWHTVEFCYISSSPISQPLLCFVFVFFIGMAYLQVSRSRFPDPMPINEFDCRRRFAESYATSEAISELKVDLEKEKKIRFYCRDTLVAGGSDESL